MHTIISLTSIPSRFPYLEEALTSLVAQEAAEIRLYIPSQYKRFRDWNGELPRVPKGITIVRCDYDFGPATKILPACLEFSGTDTQILFCDDDVIYPRGWAKRLFRVQAQRPKDAVATYVRPARGYVSRPKDMSYLLRARQLPIRYDIPYRISRLVSRFIGTSTLARRPFIIPGNGDIFFGVGGVVVLPGFFDSDTYSIPDECLFVDDIWLSASLARKGIKIYCPWMAALPQCTAATEFDGLVDSSFDGLSRFALNCRAAAYCKDRYDVWL